MGKTLEVVIAADATRAKRAFNETGTAADKMGGQVEKTGGRLKTAFAGIAAGAFLKGAFDQFAEAEKVTSRTEAVIRSTGGAAGITAGQISTLADAISKTAAVDDELVQAGANVLLTFDAINNRGPEKTFDRATLAATDLAAATGREIPAAAQMLGRALQDPEAGMGRLARAGVVLSESQKQLVRDFMATGDIAGAQDVILDAVERKFAGSAAAMATDADRMKVAFENFQESAGRALAPVLEFGSAAADAFTGLPEGVQTGALAVGGLALAYSKLSGPIRSAADWLGNWRSHADKIKTSAQGAAAGIDKVGLASKALGAAALAGGLLLLGQRLSDNKKKADDFARALTVGAETPMARVRELQSAVERLRSQASEGVRFDAGPVSLFSSNGARSAQDNLDAVESSLRDFEMEVAQTGSAQDILGLSTFSILDKYKLLEERFGAGAAKAAAMGDAQRDLGAETESTMSAADRAAAAIDRFSAAVDAYLGKTQSVPAAMDTFQSSLNAIPALVDSVKTAGGGMFDGATDSAIAFREGMRGVVENAASVVTAMNEQGASGHQVRNTLEMLATSAYNTALAMGVPEAEARKLADAIRGIPPGATTTVDAPGLDETKRRAGELKGAYDGLPGSKSTSVFAPGMADTTIAARELKGAVDRVPGSKATYTSAPGMADTTGQARQLKGAYDVLPGSKSTRVSGPGMADTTGQARELKGAYDRLPGSKSTRVSGPGMADTTGQARELKGAYDRLPGSKSTRVSSSGMADVSSQARELKGAIDRIPTSKTVTVSARILGAGSVFGLERGGIVKSYAGGGIHAHVAAGEMIRYAEPSTGGEAFVPRRGDRSRALAVLSEAAGWHGASLVARRMSAGGITRTSHGSSRPAQTIVVNVNGSVLSDRDLVDVIARAKRRGMLTGV